jgi:hypothetical protein
MFGWIKRKAAPETRIDARETLFGDMPLEDWVEHGEDVEPWEWFAEVKDHLEAGEQAQALEVLKKIVLHPDLESRHYLQAWHVLRQLGARPHASRARTLYGVVVEVGLDEGLDIVAAYADRTARYYNFTGAGVVWERPDASLDAEMAALLEAGAAVVAKIGPWEKGRPAPPPRGQVRINLLTPSGLHCGQGAFEKLAADPLAGPVLSAASVLLQALIAKTGRSVT